VELGILHAAAATGKGSAVTAYRCANRFGEAVKLASICILGTLGGDDDADTGRKKWHDLYSRITRHVWRRWKKVCTQSELLVDEARKLAR
jgi:hypothetical protein